MQIAIFGTGYVGLVTGACLADVGHHVTCVDVDEVKIEGLKRGVIPIFEPGLTDIVLRTAASGHLAFTTDAGAAIEAAELIFVAVGTPPDEDGSADLSHVLAVARTIGAHADGPKVVVDKSTVPIGTADRVSAAIAEALRERGVDHAIEVCSNPEFLKEGDAVSDFNRPARIVVGTGSDHVEAVMRRVYAPFNRNHDRMMFMDVRSAELTKYAANAMLATKISFMNELSRVAERTGADIEAVRRGIGSDPRIGYDFIYPGAGYGGSCFPKDVQALARTAGEHGVETALLDAVETVNATQKQVLFAKLEAALGPVAGRRIAVWGLAFKPRTDDMREAPSRVVIGSILDAGGTARAYDPVAGEEASRLLGDRDGFALAETAEAALEGADALVICTEWKEFRAVDPRLFHRMNRPLVIDGRNLFEPQIMAAAGIEYHSIGRAPSNA